MKPHQAFITQFTIVVALVAPVHGDGEPVCLLSDTQTKNSISAFATLAPIFYDPRCFNCHGGVNPFHSTPKHPVVTKDFGFDSPKQFEQCQECHGNFPKWQLPLPSDFFVGMNVTQLCEHMKQSFGSDFGADDFVNHMRDDNGGIPAPFIDVAYEGTMGLNETGQELYEGPFPAPPPSMPRNIMLQNSQNWVKEMGGKFQKPTECGCMDMEYALRVKVAAVYHVPAPFINSVFNFAKPDTPEADLPVIPIHFKEGGSVTGVATVNLAGNARVQTPPIPLFGEDICNVTGSAVVPATVDGQWPQPGASGSSSEGQNIHIHLTLNKLSAQASVECTKGAGSSSSGSSGSYSFDFSLQPMVGATQTVPFNLPLPGFEGSVQVTLIRTM